MSEIITYENLYELLRKEKYNPEIQELDKDFFKQTINYQEEKEAIIESQKAKDSSMFSSEIQKTQTQLSNVKKIIREIYERRESKIIQLALFASRLREKPDTSTLLPEEKEFYSELISNFNNFRRDILFSLLNASHPKIRKDDKPKPLKTNIQDSSETKLIKFLHTIPKFMGENKEIYGPFEKEDVACLPTKIAQVLLEKNRAEKI